VIGHVDDRKRVLAGCHRAAIVDKPEEEVEHAGHHHGHAH